jgi:ribosome biogenesis GTPase / thiamine phosphate phosphatase
MLTALGLNSETAAELDAIRAQGLVPGRVRQVDRNLCIVSTDEGEVSASISGRLRKEPGFDGAAVGDWVGLKSPEQAGDSFTIRHFVPRRTVLSRKAAGRVARNQVLAANVDFVLIVSGIGRDTNIRRLERFLAIVADGGATPAVVLTKADTVENPTEWTEKVTASLPNVRIHTVSSYTGQGLDGLVDMLAPGRTVMLIGTSGAGKSTLVNALLGTEVQRTSELDADGKGRHTTTGRHLFALPQGGAIIDTPGVREVALAVDEDALDNAFDDIAELALLCRFSDCKHLNEPGCAVREAVETGDLLASRLDAWRRLSAEQAGNRAALAAAQTRAARSSSRSGRR